ncbi:DUF551 domain-containing protein [Escherichia coli]|uniref:DUF551 domain-containing protein n=1 Tax=Shigella flexneri TaxID=623 RepID=UPI0003EFB22F|nr:DUF551 domain-containing protein [Escherichia coli]MCQ0386942.1 DUF551 domain-containing protein [Escherichia coli]HAH3554142.1 DUF551 domain-containing protein [Escherichia coli]
MTTITKERIELFIKNPLENGLTRGEQMELARIALASLEADPVAYIFKHPAGKLFWSLTDESNKEQADVIPVYAAAPASVVPDNASEPLAYAYKELTPEIMRNHLAVFERYGIAPNDSSTTIQALRIALDGIERRDAMLHGAEPVSQTYKLNQLSGNYPVTPDGWIRCSDRMPEDTKMLLAFSQGEIVAAYWNWVVNPIDYKKYRAFTYLSGNILDDVTHWMPLPEPPL